MYTQGGRVSSMGSPNPDTSDFWILDFVMLPVLSYFLWLCSTHRAFCTAGWTQGVNATAAVLPTLLPATKFGIFSYPHGFWTRVNLVALTANHQPATTLLKVDCLAYEKSCGMDLIRRAKGVIYLTIWLHPPPLCKTLDLVLESGNSKLMERWNNGNWILGQDQLYSNPPWQMFVQSHPETLQLKRLHSPSRYPIPVLHHLKH